MTAPAANENSVSRELDFLPLSHFVTLVLQNLEPRELRVAVENQRDHDKEEKPQAPVHVVAPVEYVPASTSEAEKDSPAVVAACGCRAFVGLIVIRRPAKLRMWMW
jgi:hypothetical protein